MMLRCVECEASLEDLPASCECRSCGGLLEVELEQPEPAPGWRDRPLGVWRYREFLPHHEGTDPVTMGEGATPLVDAPTLADEIGVEKLQLKIEGANPTGSFKDRGMTCAVSWMVGAGHELLGCASTGNTAASMAAYAARAGARSVVLLPEGKVALGKLSQAMAHGAQVLEVDGDFDDAMRVVGELAAAGDLALLNSKNPVRLEGQKTIAYEAIDQRGNVPDRIVFPVGNAGNISAAHKGLVEWRQAGVIDELPRLTGAQAAGAAPIAEAVEGEHEVRPVAGAETLATAIRIGDPVSAPKAMRAIEETGGTATSVPDEAIVDAQRALARREGVFAEPASATSVAGLEALVDDGRVDPDEDVVCVLTGHGLKDPDAAERLAEPPVQVAADPDAVRELLAQEVVAA